MAVRHTSAPQSIVISLPFQSGSPGFRNQSTRLTSRKKEGSTTTSFSLLPHSSANMPSGGIVAAHNGSLSVDRDLLGVIAQREANHSAIERSVVQDMLSLDLPPW